MVVRLRTTNASLCGTVSPRQESYSFDLYVLTDSLEIRMGVRYLTPMRASKHQPPHSLRLYPLAASADGFASRGFASLVGCCCFESGA